MHSVVAPYSMVLGLQVSEAEMESPGAAWTYWAIIVTDRKLSSMRMMSFGFELETPLSGFRTVTCPDCALLERESETQRIKIRTGGMFSSANLRSNLFILGPSSSR